MTHLLINKHVVHVLHKRIVLPAISQFSLSLTEPSFFIKSPLSLSLSLRTRERTKEDLWFPTNGGYYIPQVFFLSSPTQARIHHPPRPFLSRQALSESDQ